MHEECLFYLIRGKNAKKIAISMSLSHRTIESYIEKLKVKFNAYSKSELIGKAIEEGYLYNIPTSIMENIQKNIALFE